MGFEWMSFESPPFLNLNTGLSGYLILLVYAVIMASVAIRYRRQRSRFAGRQAVVLAALVGVTPLLARAFILRVEFPNSFVMVAIPLLGMLTTLIAGIRGGPLAGLVVGLVSGLTTALFATHAITAPFEAALAAAALGLLVDQRYRGSVGKWLRQPLLASLVAGIFVGWPLHLLGTFLTDFSSPLESLDRAASQFLPALVTTLVLGATAGILVQLAVLRWPALRPVTQTQVQLAPWQTRLNFRIFFTFFSLALLAAFVLVSTVAFTSYILATNLVVEQMSRNAVNASTGVPFFVQQGRSLIQNLAADDRLSASDASIRQAQLQNSLRSTAFFQQLMLMDATGHPLNVAPASDANSIVLSANEESHLTLALSGGVPAEVITVDHGSSVVTFIVPVIDPASHQINGALLGRARLRDNQALAPVISVLQQAVIGSGEGFLIDSQNRILLYPSHPELEQEPFTLGSASEVPSSLPEGRAYRQMLADGSRRLIYIFPVAGLSDWSVVLVEPNQVALTLAVQMALPTLLVLLFMIGVAAPAVFALTRSITSPLNDLVESADMIAQDQLDHAVNVQGHDELGRLGSAFEQMRNRLKNRLSEQDRLLQVSRAVSSNLELFRAMPPILSSALDVTRAASVRIALRHGDGPLQTYAAGAIAAGMTELDETLVELVEKGGTIVISQISRASPSLNIAALSPTVRSLAAFPLRSDTSFYGVMWLTHDHEHPFEQSELTFVSTLAGQAAIAVANARLLAEADEGRRKLEAVLESTSDGLIAVDNQGKVLLMNPAAEKHFGIRFEQARGRPAQDIIQSPDLAALLTNLQEPAASLELPGRQGATLLANTSTMVGHDGALTGRVTILRDISAMKELDNIKTVFLRMVSHDLRSPLTYMRGYLSIMPLSGELNDVQRDAIDKVNIGIQHIAEMTERLLYLSRLQFGDEAELELSLVDVKELMDEVEAEQASAAGDKDITITIDVSKKLPLLFADGMLVQQAVGNLISNAIKYTPEGGQVTVTAVTEPPGSITISVADSGVGIRPEDQSHLFEAFYRVPQREGEATRPRGTGLGLALVKAIAEAHNGSVRVQSELGSGSAFLITIPVKKPGPI